MDEVTPEMLAMARRIAAKWRKEFKADKVAHSAEPYSVQIALAAIKETSEAQRPQPSGDEIERVAMALCQNALGGKKCPCVEFGKFNCFDEHPGQQARAALAAMDREPIAVGDTGEVTQADREATFALAKTGAFTGTRAFRFADAAFARHRHTAEQSAADRVKALEEALRNARYSLEYWERECRVAGKNPKWAVGPYERGLQEIDRTRQALEGR